jgi:hypothetical protein
MSFLETGKNRFSWTALPAGRSTRQAPGCAQCGARLDMDDFGKCGASGKCLNCSVFVSEEDDVVEDLED